MSLFVQKFGGSSLDLENGWRKQSAQRAVDEFTAGNQVVMVLSAIGDRTDQLIRRAKTINPEPSPRELDMLMAVGEQESIALMAMEIHELGEEAVSLTGAQAGIRTDSVSSKARIKNIDTQRIRRELNREQIVIVAGFQGVDADENITTLGRGGSDTTAVALAAALEADQCDIFTDVKGVYTADPAIVDNAKLIPEMDYDELLELASLGAKVVHSRAVELAKRFDVPFTVAYAQNGTRGTVVKDLKGKAAEIDVRAVALDKSQARVTVYGLPDEPGMAARVFSKLAGGGVRVDIIVQSPGEGGRADLSFTVPERDKASALAVCNGLRISPAAQEIRADDQIAKVSIVGVGMKTHCGVAERMFRALADDGIDVAMISTSDIAVSCVVPQSVGYAALRAVHRAFDLSAVDQKPHLAPA